MGSITVVCVTIDRATGRMSAIAIPESIDRLIDVARANCFSRVGSGSFRVEWFEWLTSLCKWIPPSLPPMSRAAEMHAPATTATLPAAAAPRRARRRFPTGAR